MLVQKNLVRFNDVLADIKEGAREKTKSLIADLTKLSSMAMAGKVFLFSMMLSFIPMTGIQPTHSYDTAVKLDKSNPFILSAADETTKIELGESEIDRLAAAYRSATVETEDDSHRDPSEFRSLYMAAAKQFGIPWQLIEAVHEVETGKSGSTDECSYAGATGPMQFMPGTWRSYEIDGDGNGNADITDLTDSIYTAAHYLARSGADEGRIDDALFNYNHSYSYVNKVKSIAYEIGL